AGGVARRVGRFAKTGLSTMRNLGGIRSALRKGISIYRREGLAGLKRGFHIVYANSTVRPGVGSGGFDRNDYEEWIRRYDSTDQNRLKMMEVNIGSMPYKPLISIVMPVY